VDCVLELLWDFPFFADVVDMGYAVTCDLPSLDVGAPEYMIVGFDVGVAQWAFG
jgi:hypothetical protein